MTEIEARRVHLACLSDPTRDELNELRDCEITLGMTMADPKARSEAARRCEARDLTRTKKSHAQIKREVDAILAGENSKDGAIAKATLSR